MKRGLALVWLLSACSPSKSTPDGAAPDGAGSEDTASDVAPVDVAPADVAPVDVAPADVAPVDGAPADADPREGGAVACGVTRVASPKLPGSRVAAVLARAAVVVGSCIPDDGIDRNLALMWGNDVNHGKWWDRLALQADCLAAAKCGCRAVTECLGYEAVMGSFGTSKTCTGTKFEMCVQSTSDGSGCLRIDCASVGLTCDPTVICASAPIVACTPATFVPTCDAAGNVQLCDEDSATSVVLPGSDCVALGLGCAAGQCVGAGAACTNNDIVLDGELAPEGLSCAGAMLDACVGGKHATIDCTKRGPGFSCQTVGAKHFCGLGSACVPGNLPPGSDAGNVACEGDTVVLCNAGRIDRVDCRSLGFAGCEVNRSKAHYGCVPTL